MVPSHLQTEWFPSLIDRLIDPDPESRQEAPLSSSELARDFRGALCRDLTALLNTRRAAEDFDASFEESARSLLTFAIVDFTSYNFTNPGDQDQLRRSVERAIRQFEPRLERVEVSIEETESQRRLLRLEISACLRGKPGQPVVFGATVYRDSRRIAVSGGA